MVIREVLTQDLLKLKQLFNSEIPDLTLLAKSSETPDDFKASLRLFIASHTNADTTCSASANAAERLNCWIDNDNTHIDELSTGTTIKVETITNLWQFLKNDYQIGYSSDLFIDIFNQLLLLRNASNVVISADLVQRQMDRWPTGLSPNVIAARQRNRARIIDCLVHKIDRHHSSSSPFTFDADMSYNAKYAQVELWWNSSRFHLAMAAKSPSEINALLGQSLSHHTYQLLQEAKRKKMPFFVTPYYLSLLNVEADGYDDAAIRSYIIYSQELIDTYGNIKAWEKEDEVCNGHPNAAGWLLPNGNNIHRRYPEVAILIPDSIGRSCGGLCASCQRMYDFQSKRLNFDFESLKVKVSWDQKLRQLMRYFENDAQLRDILITGGDAFMSQNSTLRKLLDAVYKMAVRKRAANEKRPNGSKYAEIQRIRLGTRLLAYLPLRINAELVDILSNFKEKASAVGITQFYIQTHFQSPLELTPEARSAIEAIQSAGWTITNQLVYTVAASRFGHAAKLRQALNSVGVVCYYTFSVKGFQENYAVFAPNCRSLQETHEEKVFGLVPEDKRAQLHAIICNSNDLGKRLMQFLKENNLLFAGTDRSVLNLPAIGKSMTFKTIGLTANGRRILKFDHDTSRKHSPIIDKMGEVYIVENKSIAAYMRQLSDMGENIDEYRSIWQYGEGQTEHKFSIYEYPNFNFELTNKMTNAKDGLYN